MLLRERDTTNPKTVEASTLAPFISGRLGDEQSQLRNRLPPDREAGRFLLGEGRKGWDVLQRKVFWWGSGSAAVLVLGMAAWVSWWCDEEDEEDAFFLDRAFDRGMRCP